MKTLPFDIKYPFKTKAGQEVTIITAEGRNELWPIMGYIGDETDLHRWNAKGEPEYKYSADFLVNIPKEGEVVVVIHKSGLKRFIRDMSESEVQKDYYTHDIIVSVAVVPFSIMPGRRDDQVSELQNIVDEFN